MTQTRDFTVVKLRLSSPLHLAKGRADYASGEPLLHSDTLKSALLVCAFELFGDELEADNGTAFLSSFRVSSAFPFWGAELFFPQPLVGRHEVKKWEASDNQKKYRNVRFLGKSLFESLLNGVSKSLEATSILQEGELLSELIKPTEADFSIFKTEIEQKVAVPRDLQGDDTDASTFYMERLFFQKRDDRESGLFFLLHLENEAFRERIMAALRLLGENGIGTDRNTGNGHFDFEEEADLETVSFELPANPDQQVCLSLFCPNEAEISSVFLEKSSYQLLKRGGYIASPVLSEHLTFRKKSVFMFSEGSVFPNGKTLVGKPIDLKPDAFGERNHPIWRDGRAIFLPMKSQTKKP